MARLYIELTQIEAIVNVLEVLGELLNQDGQLQEQVIRDGLIFKKVSNSEFKVIQQEFKKLNFSNYTFANAQLTLRPPNQNVQELIKLLFVLIRQNDRLLEILLNKIICIDNLDPDKAREIQEYLNSKGIKAAIEEEKPQSYIVRGTVTQSSNISLPNLIVRAFDWDSQGEELLGETITDTKGNYQITYTDEDFSRFDIAGGPDLIVRAYNQQGEILASSPRKNNARVQETVDLTIAISQEDVFIVRGTIRRENNSPVVGFIVRAFDRDLRAEQLLGEQTTNTKGYYEIAYTQAQFRRAEKGSADLVIRLFDANGEAVSALALTTDTDTPLETITYNDSQGNAVSIPIWFNAPPVATINGPLIDIQRQTLSLYECIWLDISPFVENIPPADLRVPDIAFLAPEAALEKAILARFILAHRLAQRAIQPEFWFVVLGGSVYEYREERSLEEQLEEVLAALPSLDAIAVGKALTRGFNLQEISKDFQDNAPDWIEAFLQFIARHTVSDSEQPTFVKLALEDANIRSPEKQTAFARLFNQYRAITPELLDTLEQDDTFTTTEIADLRTSFQLSNLTQGDFSVIKTIKQEFSVRQPEQIRTLAKRSESEWVNLVTTKHGAGEINLPIEVGAIAGETQLPEAEIYGKMLDRQFREAFPTTAFTGGLERTLQNGGSQGLRRAGDMSRFLNRHESFELLNTPVDEFLQERIDPEFRELAEDENFKLEVKAVQRVFKLAPTFEATDTLLADDL
ncbi:MAG: hypothetical protein SW833_28715, partial [Cyanobacteriota bacterium]|nr:hypothetical protein [Cyanobacteriota bacterium]